MGLCMINQSGRLTNSDRFRYFIEIGPILILLKLAVSWLKGPFVINVWLIFGGISRHSRRFSSLNRLEILHKVCRRIVTINLLLIFIVMKIVVVVIVLVVTMWTNLSFNIFITFPVANNWTRSTVSFTFLLSLNLIIVVVIRVEIAVLIHHPILIVSFVWLSI